jgi:hypothetical protein
MGKIYIWINEYDETLSTNPKIQRHENKSMYKSPYADCNNFAVFKLEDIENQIQKKEKKKRNRIRYAPLK